jgi:hypothetical protein
MRDARQATLATIVLLAHSYMAIWAMAQYVDMDLAFYILASAGLMLLSFDVRDAGPPALAGFTTGLAAWTKNEGLAFAALSTAIWLVAARADRAAVRNFLAGISFPLLVVGLFKIFLAPANDVLGADQDLPALVLDPTRYEALLRVGALTFRYMDGSPLLVLIGLLLYALALGPARRATPGLAPAVLILLGQLAMYFAVLVITPYSPEWHVRSSIGRLYLQVAPLMLLCAFLWVKSPRELDTGTGR